MLNLTAEHVLSILRGYWHLFLSLAAFLPTLVLVRVWFVVISLAM